MSLREGLTLNENEVIALAYRLAMRQLDTDWLQWEDVPMLAESSFLEVEEKVQAVRNYLKKALRLMESTWDVDTADLLERVS